MSEQPHEVLWNLTVAGFAARALQVVAELGVADHLGDGPATAAELSARQGLDPDALHRVLCLLADHGMFRRDGDRFWPTPASELLRSDHPRSMRAFSRMIGLPAIVQSLAELGHSLRTGAPAIQAVEPRGFWAYLESRSDEAAVFGQAMQSKAGADVVAVLQAYDFGGMGRIADIGGGRGHLLRAVLDGTPQAQGFLFDLPAVIDALEVQHPRLTPRAGDFFVDPLPEADGYLLMEVLHDWPDAEATAILAAVRRAAVPGARVLIVENVLSDDGPDERGHTLDIIMLAVTGGRERTETELAKLLARSGFGEPETIPTEGPLKIVTARAV
jgi:C-methyltransferase